MFEPAWSTRTVEDDPGAPFFNDTTKYVVSWTLTEGTWRNSEIVGAYDADRIRRLKDEVEGDIYISGSGQLVRALLADGLIDGLHLFVYPLTLGPGPRVFDENVPVQALARGEPDLRQRRRLPALSSGVVKFGLYGLHKGENTAPEALARRARAAEDAGFESLWVGDHIALPADAPDDAFDPRLEAVVTLAHLAAVTERVRLGLGVIILPQRQPVLLAKQLTSVDVLSGGRLLVGLGVGYLEAELGALGATLAERGARMDESIAAMQMLWDEAAPDFQGRFVSFANVFQRPLPVQRPHPPLVIGGDSPAALRRARAAGAWYGWEQEPEQIADDARAARRRRRDHAHAGAAGSDRSRAGARVRGGRRLAARAAAAGHDRRGDGRADRERLSWTRWARGT